MTNVRHRGANSNSHSALFRKLLIANRGEIACRITRTARRLGMTVVAVHSDVDRNAMHVALADESVEIGGARPSESYLNADKILQAANQVNADAIHPGYGFLSENSILAELCEKQSIEFIGPPSTAIRIMASKSTAAGIAQKARVPVLSGYRDSSQKIDSMIQAAKDIGFPILLKSSAGGGGRGMRIVRNEDEFSDNLLSARSEAKEAFDDDVIIIEKYLENARHIEVQIAADKHGNVRHLFDRECSAQRRYQKIVEEAPAPQIPPDVRTQMCESAISLSKLINYHNVGTLEFLVDGEHFYFMEMNTRLQVEHPVTEQVTNTDLVEWQLRIAAGESIDSFPIPEQPEGHSMEVRIYAENPLKNFLPSPGQITYLSLPQPSDNIQVHTGVREGDNVDRHYDPLIAKLVSWKSDRSSAIQHMLDALIKVRITGVDTNLEFLANLLRHKTFQDETIDVKFVENHHEELTRTNSELPEEIAALTSLYLNSMSSKAVHQNQNKRQSDAYSPWQSGGNWRMNSIREYTQNFEFNDQIVNVIAQLQRKQILVKCGCRLMDCTDYDIHSKDISANIDGTQWCLTVVELTDCVTVFHGNAKYELVPTDKISSANTASEHSGSLTAPLPGRVVRVLINEGESVSVGQNLIVIEAMKMEHHITSPVDGIVSSVNFSEDDQVDEGATCVVVEPTEISEPVAG